MQFSRKHPLWQQAKAKRDLALDLYEGGSRVEGKEEYLTRHPFETKAQYEIRLKRAAYRNFAAPIVDIFSSFVCDGRPLRTLPDELLPMLVNINRRQTNADVFFANQVRLAAAGGAVFTLCDMEREAGLTQAENRAAGRRQHPYFAAYEADDVWDWNFDSRGLAWVVLHDQEITSSRPFEARLWRNVWTVWTREGWRKYADAEREEVVQGFMRTMAVDLDKYELIGEGGHPLGEVPLVPLLFEPVTPMTGNPVTDDVLSLILRVYRRDSELDKMLFDCAVPLGIFNGLDPESKEAFIRSSSNILVSSNSANPISGQYIEPAGRSFTALREALDSDIASIREIALRMARPVSGVGESAEAKALDKQQLDTQLASFARRCGDAERKCWELAYKWLHGGQAPQPEAIETPYNEDYSVDAVEKLDNEYLLEMLRNGAISKESYLRLLQKLGTLPADFDIDAEITALDMEVKTGAGPEGMAAKHLSDLL